jgi:hypothetical protein
MVESKRPPPEEIILYAKEPKTKIATITFNRSEFLDAPTSAARLRYADLLRAVSADDDVKVVVIRGVGDDFKQYQGEYIGSLLSAFFESMGSHIHHDADDLEMGDAIERGLSDAVKDNDSKFPPEFRLSKSSRTRDG